jgi:dienelactone hydrolase
MSNFFTPKSLAKNSSFIRHIAAAFAAGLISLAGAGVAAAENLDASLNEQVVMVPAMSGNTPIELETTIFKPPGDGPFPLVIMNHGKALGDPHAQSRDRFIVISREFVKRGYAVVIPMRKGFAKSTGTYVERICDMAGNGQLQADDLENALKYILTQSWADKTRILVAGQSYGGLATMAFGTRNFPGVRGLINFAGGLRLYGGTCPWQTSLINAFAEYGAKTSVPSLWFYGENDGHFAPALAQQMHRAYVQSGHYAKLVAYGPFKNDAHGMSASWDGVRIWWPETENFLKSIGMPTEPVLALDDGMQFPKSDFAALDNIDAVPYLQEKGRDAYRVFLTKPMPRAFAVSSSGAWSWAEDGDDPPARVLANCQKNSVQPCKLYAVDDYVVWTGDKQP